MDNDIQELKNDFFRILNASAWRYIRARYNNKAFRLHGNASASLIKRLKLLREKNILAGFVNLRYIVDLDGCREEFYSLTELIERRADEIVNGDSRTIREAWFVSKP